MMGWGGSPLPPQTISVFLWLLPRSSQLPNMLQITGLLALGLAGSGFSLAESPPSLNFLGEGTDRLSRSLLLAEAENRTNLVFSPLGYSVILAILAEGSRGSTRSQLTSYLNYPEDTYAARTTYKTVLSSMQEKFAINQPEFKNWFYFYKNCSIDNGYKAIVEENFLTQVREIDGEDSGFPGSSSQGEVTEEEIEDSSNTPLEEVDLRSEATTVTVDSQQISARSVEQEIMSAISANRLSTNQDNSSIPESRMIVFNALYYRGRWVGQFAQVEGGSEFECADGVSKTVQSIQATGEFEYGRLRQLRATAINIPYEGGRYSLLLILPDRSESLVSLIKRLPKLSLTQVEAQLSKRQVKATIPKFKYYTITRPKECLIKEGVEDVFDEKADLSGITGEKGLYLDDLVQLVTIEVSQDSAAYNFLTTTNVANVRASVVEFNAQRPFLYFLRDRVDNYVVVAGKVEDPSVES